MKKPNQLFIFLGILLFSCIGTALAQQTHYVTLHVNTAEITSQNESSVCYFTAQSPDAEQIRTDEDLENFTIHVNAGDLIIWNGVSSNSPDTDYVNITSINYQGGENVFDQNVLNGNGETPEIVVGMVNDGTNGYTEKYVIYFTVYVNGEKRGGKFHIDPKIAVKP